MSIIEYQLPILERDTKKEALLMPEKESKPFPKKAAFLFLEDETERYALSHGGEKIGEFVTIMKTFVVYKINYKGEEVCICQAPLGAPAAVSVMEYLIANGVEQIIACGTCGALVELEEHAFIIPTRAVRDEGTSYHYIEAGREIELNKKAVDAISFMMKKNDIHFRYGKVWTTDGFFRETTDMVVKRKKEECIVVDMECSALAAVAEFRGICFGQILFTADTLADGKHDARDWGYSVFSQALQLALEAILCY
ncbi:nucleoside phosphorylase [Velocimicrobium porci]|uniref:Uridine phosphorylase n=1 Tax=Velocimicrobium porci TaxID=2606634 RepID=A0A6L5Y2A9_9FIRM|nr:nucleoside phosphorylase [Velocimicrobium porci]MSS64243.1 nucleoside phosphorylase [Velocimicrobium porci]